jgi:hypothetical protein
MAVEKKLLTTQHVPMRQIGAGDGNQDAYNKGYAAINWTIKAKPEPKQPKQQELDV